MIISHFCWLNHHLCWLQPHNSSQLRILIWCASHTKIAGGSGCSKMVSGTFANSHMQNWTQAFHLRTMIGQRCQDGLFTKLVQLWIHHPTNKSWFSAGFYQRSGWATQAAFSLQIRILAVFHGIHQGFQWSSLVRRKGSTGPLQKNRENWKIMFSTRKNMTMSRL